MSGVKFKVPHVVEIDILLSTRVIKGKKFEGKKISRDKFYVLLFLIYDRWLVLKDVNDDDYFAFINASRILKPLIGNDYEWYLSSLKYHGLLECDELYIPKKKPYGYRLSEDYRFRDEEEYLLGLGTPLSAKFKDYFEAKKIKTSKEHKHLDKWFNIGKLSLDYETAKKYCLIRAEEYDLPIKKKYSWKEGRLKESKQDPNKIKWRENIYFLDRIRRGAYRATVADTNNRYISTISNMKSELRNFLTYDGKPLVNIDIKNS